MARQVGQQLAERWKVNVVIDNKPGGGGQIGAAEVARAAGDGQTLLAITMTHAANVTLFKGRAGFDFQKDLRPVALLAGSPMLVVVPAASAIKDFKDLVQRARVGKLNAGSSGNGTPPHLTLALFNDLQKTDIQHVPYKGGAPAITDLIGGQINYSFDTMTAATPHVKSGKAIAIAQTRQNRVSAYANVPTMAESGFPGFEATTWYGLAGPAKMPVAMAKRMNEDVNKVMLMPDVMEKLAASGAQDGGGSTEKFGDFMRAEQIKWAKIIKDGGVKAES